MHITAVILAGGQSRRLGRPKQLLDYRGKKLLQHVVDAALASSVDAVVVVLGGYRDEVERVIDFTGTTVAFNPQYAAGQSTAIRTAIEALSPATDAAIFLLGDQPDITPDMIDAIATGYRPPAVEIVVPVHNDVRGNPVLFGRPLFSEILDLLGDQGARPLIERHPTLVAEVPLSGNPLRDVDTEEDYAELLRNTRRS